MHRLSTGRAASSRYLVLAAALCTSASSIFIRYTNMPSLAISLYRMAFAALLMLVPAAAGGFRGLRAMGRRDLLLCTLSGTALAVHFAAWIASLSLTTVSASTVLVACSPVFVALLEAVFFRRRPGRRLMLCIGFAILGSAIIAIGGIGGGAGSLKGNLLALAGAFFVAIYFVVGQSVRARVDNNTYTFAVYSVAALVLLACCAASPTPLGPYPAGDIGLVAAMALVCSIGGHTLYNWLLARHSAVLISLAALCEPVFASLLALALLGEVPGWPTLVGGCIILASLAAYTAAKEKS